MRVLYCGLHGVLEFDELRLLSKAATSLFSVGFYSDPTSPTLDLRPPLEIDNYDWEALRVWREQSLTHENFTHNLAFMARFDVLVLVHSLEPVRHVLGAFPVPILLRTIGQNDAGAEAFVAGIRSRINAPFYIVRYSPREIHIPHFAGSDATIRFGKVMSDYAPRGGRCGRVVAFGTGLLWRSDPCNYTFFQQATEPFERVLYGRGNPETGFNADFLTYPEQLDVLSRASVFYSIQTAPASYVLNLVEAMAAGCPVVAPGRRVLASDETVEKRVRLPDAYETPDILEGAPITLALDSVEDAHRTIRRLLEDDVLAAEVGSWCRTRAEALFSSDVVVPDWQAMMHRISADKPRNVYRP